MDELADYLDLVAEVWRDDPTQREGQAYFNAARMKWPGLVDDIIGTEYDPFTLDRHLPAFLEWLDQAVAARRRPA